MISRVCLAWMAWVVPLGVAAADWAQWRGPTQDGHVPAGIPVPVSLPAEPSVVWRIKIGGGLASPVVSGGRVFFLDEQRGKEVVHAADAATGHELWSTILDDSFRDSQSAPGPRCTPMVDGDRVYAQSCRGQLKCLGAADGAPRWQWNYPRDFGAIFIGERGQAAGASRHGYDGSPVIDGEHLLACAGGTNGASVVCFDKRTGTVVWKSQNDIPGYGPPVLTRLGGVPQALVFTASALMGLNPATGALLWRVPVTTSLGRHVTTPVVIDDMVFVSSHQAGLIGVKVTKMSSSWKAEPQWIEKSLAVNFSSPVAYGGHLFAVGPAKNLLCVEATTGKLAWSQEGCFTTSPDKAFAGLLVMRKNILALTDTGELILFEADSHEFRSLGRSQVCGANWCVPAYVDGCLFLRDRTDLLRVRLLP